MWCILNPAASVKGVKEQVIEGKTPEITHGAGPHAAGVDQCGYREVARLVGLRDRAILATLAYTACRAGAVAKLRLGDFQHDGAQYVLRFQEKGGKSREIPVRHDLEGFILAYLEAAGIAAEAKDRPLFRAGNGRTKQLTGNAMTSKAICELVKRRLKDAGLPSRLSPHSFRVTAITDLLDARGAAGGCAIPGRACGAANDGALRPAAEEGDAEHRRADFDLITSFISYQIGKRDQANCINAPRYAIRCQSMPPMKRKSLVFALRSRSALASANSCCLKRTRCSASSASLNRVYS